MLFQVILPNGKLPIEGERFIFAPCPNEEERIIDYIISRKGPHAEILVLDAEGQLVDSCNSVEDAAEVLWERFRHSIKTVLPNQRKVLLALNTVYTGLEAQDLFDFSDKAELLLEEALQAYLIEFKRRTTNS